MLTFQKFMEIEFFIDTGIILCLVHFLNIIEGSKYS